MVVMGSSAVIRGQCSSLISILFLLFFSSPRDFDNSIIL